MFATTQPVSSTTKPPRAVLSEVAPTAEHSSSDYTPNATNQVFAFSPNRDTLGGTSYFLVTNQGNILIDCPALEEINQEFITAAGGITWLFITHRTAIGKAGEFQKFFHCPILIQEQEAYLLPGVDVTTFRDHLLIGDKIQVIWTPGHSPGSSCLYYSDLEGILFSGRHLVPDPQGQPTLLRTSKTFHWPRQVKSMQLLSDRLSSQPLKYVCPGGNIGYLRGKFYMSFPAFP